MTRIFAMLLLTLVAGCGAPTVATWNEKPPLSTPDPTDNGMIGLRLVFPF